MILIFDKSHRKKKKKKRNLFFDKPAKCFSAIFLKFQNLNSSGLQVFKPGNKRPETKGYLGQSILKNGPSKFF